MLPTGSSYILGCGPRLATRDDVTRSSLRNLDVAAKNRQTAEDRRVPSTCHGCQGLLRRRGLLLDGNPA